MRLFVAIPFDVRMRKALTALLRDLRRSGFEGNFSQTENLHLTLAFIGENDNAAGVISTLEQVYCPAFDLKTQVLGHFGDLIWLGLTYSKDLENLAMSVRKNLQTAGIEIDHKAFKPHITLARRTNIERLGEQALPAFPQQRMTVSSFSLMSSERERGKLVYRELANFPL
ncbi:MAG: RNA 2',3'-cyclic phosphodiesterase [Eubacteriales bacterium]|nr:RNA 2',3'-cyclic phosphodiesterase [Eubacteriales bacterium]